MLDVSTTTAFSANPYAPPALDSLVNWMKGSQSTDQWDVVCSYSVDQLNRFLGAQYDAGKLAREVRITTQVEDPVTGDPLDIEFDLKFASPTLAFVAGRSGYATLTMRLKDGGSYTINVPGRPPKVTPIPGDKYSIEATVPLAAIKGDTGTVSPAGNVVTFSDGSNESAHVIVHFKNEKGATFQLVPQATGTDNLPLNIWLMPVLLNYFQTQVSEIDYALTGLNNSKPKDGSIVLTPKAFVFTSSGDATTGVLSLYIQTDREGSLPGNPDPSFKPGGQETVPVPDGYSASIILSYDLLTRSYLKPQLEKNGFKVSFVTTTNGIRVQLKSDQSVVADSNEGHVIFSNWDYGGLNISLNDFPLTMLLQDSKLQLQWEGRATSEWSEVTAGMGHTSPRYGKIDITITLNEPAVALGTLSDSDLTLASITLGASDFTVKTDSHSCSFWERLGGCSESVPEFYERDMKLRIPSINLALPGLDFFATTNLLSPGQHVIDIATKAGVKTPCDFLIVGKVAQRGGK
ncbi:hypothetical protein [Sorangium sp. So ce385]|uniref:hypothetical protein n=1 Tax=Sorangium sp. So ce385 TaxID=3133308 RepID=UPI003F5B2EFC